MSLIFMTFIMLGVNLPLPADMTQPTFAAPRTKKKMSCILELAALDAR